MRIRARAAAAFSLALAGLLGAAGGLSAQGEPVRCPVTGKTVEVTSRTPSIQVNGKTVYFCSTACPRRFAARAEEMVRDAGNCPVNRSGTAKVSTLSRAVLNNRPFYFCCASCPKAFRANPGRFVRELEDPVTGKPFSVRGDSPREEVDGQIYLFANRQNQTAFQQNRSRYVLRYSEP